jgi:serpin B
MTLRNVLAAAVVAAVAAACSSSRDREGGDRTEPSSGAPAAIEPEPEPEPEAISDVELSADLDAPTSEQLAAFASASNALALDLYARVRTREGNLAFSPASIQLALGMTWAGARGATADEMQRVLRIEASQEDFHDAASRILAAWNRPGAKGRELRVVNRLFGERTYEFEAAFVDLTRSRYRAPLQAADFRGGAEAERGRINGWVEQQTSGRIAEILPPGSLDGLTRLVLVNAVYFLGRWEHAFEPSATIADDFYLDGGERTTASLMTRTRRHRYAEVGGVKILELPYRGGDLAMTVVLPGERGALAAVESSLDARRFSRWTRALREQRVEVYLPRFEIRGARLPLAEILPESGMRRAFDAASADFTGIGRPDDPDEMLHLSGVFHETFVKVDEEGTEAAAATAAVMGARGMAPVEPPTPVFRADHPFLFFVRDLESETILFVGRVARP